MTTDAPKIQLPPDMQTVLSKYADDPLLMEVVLAVRAGTYKADLTEMMIAEITLRQGYPHEVVEPLFPSTYQ